MPRYHFNVNDGVENHDDDGTELTNLDSARQEAIKYCGSLLIEGAPNKDFGRFWCMQVTDHAGLILLSLDFSVTGSPAASIRQIGGSALSP